MKRIVCLALVLLLLSGCSPEENQATPSPTATQTPVEQPEIKRETAQGQETVLTWSVTRPVLQGADGNPVFEKINRVFEKEAKEYEERAKGEWKTYATKEKARMEAEGEKFSPHTYQRTFTVKYARGERLSILVEDYAFEGGAYPSASRIAHTYDLRTGEELTLAQALGKSREETEKQAADTLTGLIREEPELYLTGIEEKLTDLMPQMGFYLEETEEGETLATVYFPTDTLAPRAMGFPGFSVQIEKNS